jgi:hypothetical protein
MRYFLTAIILILIVACSKNKPEDQQADPCNNILEVLRYQPYGTPTYQTTASLTYDDQGRIKTVIGEGSSRSDYTYFNDRIVLTAKDIFGNDISTTYYLDNMQRVTRTNYYDYQYTYNSDGCLISYRQPYGNNGQITGFTQYYLKWEDGNIAEVYTNDANIADRKYAFQYYIEPNQNLLGYNSPLYISNVVGDRPSFFLIGSNFFGKQPKNLYKTLIKNDVYNGTVTYQYDAKGRISSIKDVYQFNYKCQ